MQPPRDLAELSTRVRALAGHTLHDLAARIGDDRPWSKGRTGELMERLLGASAGCTSRPDFVDLGVELKTLPVDPDGRPRESTFVCSLPLSEVDRWEWSSSPVRHKLAHVLWLPIVHQGDAERVGSAFFWSPSPEEEAVLRADFEEIVGMIALGHVEALHAGIGQWLQARPKAAHGAVRRRAYGSDDEPLSMLPRGLYLRRSFTWQLMQRAFS